MGYSFDRTLWRWFNKKSMQWVQVVKLNDGGCKPWLLIRGRDTARRRDSTFPTLGDLIAALFEHELESLIEKEDIPAMELIAMAADEGEAA